MNEGLAAKEPIESLMVCGGIIVTCNRSPVQGRSKERSRVPSRGSTASHKRDSRCIQIWRLGMGHKLIQQHSPLLCSECDQVRTEKIPGEKQNLEDRNRECFEANGTIENIQIKQRRRESLISDLFLGKLGPYYKKLLEYAMFVLRSLAAATIHPCYLEGISHTREKVQKRESISILGSVYDRRVSERAGALRFFVKMSFLCFSVACYPDRLRWWQSGWSNDAVVWRFLGVVKLTCQFKFRFREVEAYIAPSPPALVSGRWELLQLCHCRLLSPESEGFLNLTPPPLGVSIFLIGVCFRFWIGCGLWFMVTLVRGFDLLDEISI
ncbi:LOW QUALITY PROTEIN: hypothetical protein HID58_016703 [Brassica napus]|uniref:Uncharacterized protein n=1 Tax=Brassica napus TaxID=3708 RepID=A0ABQ7XJ49_BRANA|nr:LOW QUALITY PROTEIN: hypothetical protein HID58_016703 [Brassica napus]